MWPYLTLCCRQLLLLSLLLYTARAGWRQVGSDLDGQAANDYAGTSVAISTDGLRIAVGYPGSDGNGAEAGRVRVFDWSSSADDWQQVGQSIDSEAAGDISGFSLDLSSSGHRIAIGAISNGGAGVDAGHVRVFALAGGSWVQMGGDMDGVSPGDAFGFSVALSSDGDRVAVGAPYNDASSVSAGQVRVFRYSSSVWSQVGENINGLATQALAGAAVALSGDGSRVVVGAPGARETTIGYVSVYDYLSLSWTLAGNHIYGVNAGDFFGSTISLSRVGLVLAVGARNHNGGNGQYSGQARVYEYDLGEWGQMGGDIYGAVPNDNCGTAIDLSNDGYMLAVGSPGYFGSAVASGRVRVFTYRDNDDEWDQIEGDIYGEAANDGFGAAVRLSGDGEYVAIGALDNDGAGTAAGHARVL
ncbi:unnamed protein product, partial [Ectocarpus fasciculatus]